MVARRWAGLAKPAGSLGRLEQLAQQLAAITGTDDLHFSKKAVAVFVADHGVVAEGVSAYPAAVTSIMLRNFLQGGAAINVLARFSGADIVCVDVGVAGDGVVSTVTPVQGVRFFNRRVRSGTANMARQPAMEPEEAAATLSIGREVAARLAGEGYALFAVGEMGIGNTTAAAAITAVFTGAPVDEVVGPGAGLTPEGVLRKRAVVEQALALHRPDPARPLAVLSAIGGLEIGAMAGFLIGAAELRRPVVIDGVIGGAAALLADALVPGTRQFIIAGHLSAEPAHRHALERLGLLPYLDLGMRLGEGTGAVLAFPLIDAACRLLSEMATLESLGIKPPGD